MASNIAMNAQEFIYKVIYLYRKARKPVFANAKIKRGRSRSIASLLEDLFAAFLIENVKCEYIYVDQPLSVVGLTKQAYPDISITRNGLITSFCDLKTNLGWNRDGLADLCEHHFRWLKNVRGKTCVLYDGVNKKEENYKISKRASYNIVILSECNIKSALLKEQIENANRFRPDIEIFTLTSKQTNLNSYDETVGELRKKADIHYPVFKKLIQKLNK